MIETFEKCKRNYLELLENDPERMSNPEKFKEHKWWCVIQIRNHIGCDCNGNNLS